jgi:hypothetical protein
VLDLRLLSEPLDSTRWMLPLAAHPLPSSPETVRCGPSGQVLCLLPEELRALRFCNRWLCSQGLQIFLQPLFSDLRMNPYRPPDALQPLLALQPHFLEDEFDSPLEFRLHRLAWAGAAGLGPPAGPEEPFATPAGAVPARLPRREACEWLQLREEEERVGHL